MDMGRARAGIRAWRSLAIILALLALTLSACSVSFGSGTNGTLPPDYAPTAGGQQGCEPQTKHDTGSSDSFNTYLSPKQLWTLYGIEPLLQQCHTGKGQSIVVIDSFGSPTLQQDLDTFSDYYGLPRTTLQILAPLGTVPFDASNEDMAGWAGETTEDVQIIHAVAPDAKIVVLTSPVSETEGTVGLPEFRQLEQYAVQHQLGTIVSQSWAATETTLDDSAGQQEIAKWDTFFHDATTQSGITFFAGSGDLGATDYIVYPSDISSTPTTAFPTSDPWVTSVGGTTIQQNGSDLSEVGWDGSGGGFSRFYAEPSFQQGLPTSDQQLLNSRRGVPDVASSADPSIGLGCFISALSGSGNTAQARMFVGNGTSAGSPLWSGLIAIASQMAGRPLGYINTALYQIGNGPNYSRDFNDITSGNNSYSDATVDVQGWDATQGWDPVTGWGTPNAQYLLPDLIAATNAS